MVLFTETEQTRQPVDIDWVQSNTDIVV